MKRIRIPMTLALGAALTIAPLSFASAEETPAPKSSQTTTAAEVGLHVNLDVLGIANQIADAIKSAQNRDGFVKNLMESSFYASGQKYNVMVFNLSQEYEDHLNGVQFYGSAVYDGMTYGIWVFEDETFTNKGDGGWINWAFRGWFDRDGSTVEFHRPFFASSIRRLQAWRLPHH
ncbi:stress response protein YvgO [Bacillus vallismortis]|uniref:stress response protein YvgO n=1 Tax=Bacillus vallismortis TaxID=72361 RepID=UPI002282C8F1|nr:stress response protein YvgO [Bacillus vallismortis]MCY8548080.1 stress protein [Bacillus vallismortis]